MIIHATSCNFHTYTYNMHTVYMVLAHLAPTLHVGRLRQRGVQRIHRSFDLRRSWARAGISRATPAQPLKPVLHIPKEYVTCQRLRESQSENSQQNITTMAAATACDGGLVLCTRAQASRSTRRHCSSHGYAPRSGGSDTPATRRSIRRVSPSSSVCVSELMGMHAVCPSPVPNHHM